MRLIDADLLKDSLRSLEARGTNIDYVKGLQNAIDDYFPQIIDDAPTIDAKPVKHMEYKNEAKTDNDFICSRCKIHLTDLSYVDVVGYEDSNDVYNPKYCPNCGAKMDGGEKK